MKIISIIHTIVSIPYYGKVSLISNTRNVLTLLLRKYINYNIHFNMYQDFPYLFSTQVRGMATLKESKYFVLIVMVGDVMMVAVMPILSSV